MSDVPDDPGPCRRRTRPDDVIGAPCPVCGHTNLVHGGNHNPAIDECLLCPMQYAAQVILDIGDAFRALMDRALMDGS